MCIVSLFTNENEDFILTHNRDEHISRKVIGDPVIRNINDIPVEMPLDERSNGTWIFHSERYAACILNGADKFHVRKDSYRKSRGQLILELLDYPGIDDFINDVNLTGIEAFTLIMLDLRFHSKKILIWDESLKYTEDIGKNQKLVRSSSTLYTDCEKKSHKSVLNNIDPITKDTIFGYHKELSMPGNLKFPGVQTTSITQITGNNEKTELKFCPIL